MIPQLLPIYRNLRYRTLLSDSWTPAELFASSEVGVWYDPSDLSTMFQDAAGTVPVTAVGDPVCLIQDKLGNGYDASQVDSTLCPILRQDENGNYWLDPVLLGGMLESTVVDLGADVSVIYLKKSGAEIISV